MVFVTHEQDRAALDANVALQQSLGVKTEILDSRQLRDVEPRGRFEDDVVAAFEPEAGFVDPGRTLQALASLCREAGVVLRENALVTDVRVEAGRVRGVEIDGGETIDAPTVINAGGPWAARLCAQLGVDLPLTAIRPEQAYLVPPGSHGAERYIFGDLLTGLYWKPEPAGWTRVGKMAYDGDEEVPDPDEYDEGVSHAFIDFCRQRLATRIPAYADSVSWGGCGALYTITPDAHALIGPVPGIEGFHVVSGFSGHGFKMGPAVGQGVAALVAGTDPGAFQAAFFAPERFAEGRQVQTAYEYGILG